MATTIAASETTIPATAQPDAGLAVIGGGITGLTAAYEAMKRGEKNIHVYEATNRMGGKIQSGMVGGQTINRGAEFIDSGHAHLIELARDMKVGFVENKGMEKETFLHLDGRPMPDTEFYEAYKPYAQQVMADRAEIERNPQGERAKYLSTLTLDQYAAQLGQSIPPVNRSFWRMLADTVMLRANDNARIAEIAAKSFASEMGQPLSNISATQFMAETSSDVETFLASDCKYRVKGGTEALIVKLRETLAANGVKFHTGAQLASATKSARGGVNLAFADSNLNTHASKTILALPSYAFKDIQGLDTLGFAPAAQQQLADTQYTNSFKLTVAFKPGMATPDGAFYSPNGFQCWSPAPGLLTFLSNADEIGAKPAKQVIMERLEAYAKVHGSSAEKMFDLSKLDYNNPGKQACYATPKPGQAQALEALRGHLPALAKNGVGVAGTFMPIDGCVGFMECGVLSAKQSVEMVVGQEKSVGVAPQKQWVQQLENQRAAANDPAMQVAANSR